MSILELVVLAIVADVVPPAGREPLSPADRFAFTEGNPAYRAEELYRWLAWTAFDSITEEEIAFGLDPLINSAGRILRADLAGGITAGRR